MQAVSRGSKPTMKQESPSPSTATLGVAEPCMLVTSTRRRPEKVGGRSPGRPPVGKSTERGMAGRQRCTSYSSLFAWATRAQLARRAADSWGPTRHRAAWAT